jgi:RNase adaptor protein for sRNA GlmZ degradation
MADSSTPTSGDPDHHFAPPSAPSNTDYRHARWPRAVPTGSSRPPQTRPLTNPHHSLPPIRNQQDPRRVVVVGVCGSGKSTLVRALRERGFDARTVSQEHSYVPRLWQRSRPDVLVYLDASLHTIRGRGRRTWPQSLLDTEHDRLSHAREHTDLYIPTDGLAPEDVASRVVTFLRNKT